MTKSRISRFVRSTLLVAVFFAAASGQIAAELFINEIYLDPPGGLDPTHEYVELRGTPEMSLDGYYLIFIENESNSFQASNAGEIEHIFDLNGRAMGTNGFLTFRQRRTVENENPYTVAPGTTDLINTGTGAGFGSGAGSSIGSTDEPGNDNVFGQLENGGFTAMLIHNVSGVAPTISPQIDLDIDNNGLDHPTAQEGWDIIDAIGYTEPGEAFNARYYAKINFGTEFENTTVPPEDENYFNPADHIEPGAVYVGLGYEVEMLARWGNSTGQTAADWHVTNLTNDPGSGYQPGTPNFRQSTSVSHPAPNALELPPDQPSQVDTNQGVPYATILNNTLGAPDYMSGDFNKDGYVNAADYVVWRKSMADGVVGSDLADVPADPNHDYVVDADDFAIWRANFGLPHVAAPQMEPEFHGPHVVPEPSALLLTGIAALLWAGVCRRLRTH